MKEIFPFYRIGHFINQPDSLSEFEILRFENMEEPDVDSFHKHSFYEILWTEKGRSRQFIDYTEYEVKPCSLFFISPDQVHRFEEWKPLTGGTILFTEDFYLLNRSNRDTLFELSFLDNLYADPCVTFDRSGFGEILGLIRCIEAEQIRVDRNPSVVQAYLHILLTQVQRRVNSTGSGSDSKRYLVLFKQFKQVLENHFSANRTASFYAQQLHITPHHLNVVCKSIVGKTATEVVRARTILEAKRMLTFTTKTIAEIAFDLNIADSSYFSRMFKAEVRQTPQHFRTVMSEKYRTM